MVVHTSRAPCGSHFEVTFDPYRKVRKLPSIIVIAGTFNGWRTDLHPSLGLCILDADRQPITIPLSPGLHEYKYFDGSRGEWMEVEQVPIVYPDNSEQFVWNPFGTLNCLLELI